MGQASVFSQCGYGYSEFHSSVRRVHAPLRLETAIYFRGNVVAAV